MSKLTDALVKEKEEAKEVCLWMYFADPNKPKGTQLLGVIITKCFSLTHAAGINLGGVVQAAPVNPDDYTLEHFDILLSESDLQKADYI